MFLIEKPIKAGSKTLPNFQVGNRNKKRRDLWSWEMFCSRCSYVIDIEDYFRNRCPVCFLSPQDNTISGVRTW